MFLHTGKFRIIRVNYDLHKSTTVIISRTQKLLQVWFFDANIPESIICSVYLEPSSYYSLQSKISMDKHYFITFRHTYSHDKTS